MYPSMYRYNDSATITRYLNEEFNSVKDSQTTIEVYRRIAKACAKMNDEHLIPTPPKWYYDSLKQAKYYFPFSIKIINKHWYVWRGYNLPQQFPVGAEIISINGRTIAELFKKLTATIPSDGYIETFDTRHLEDYSMTQNENLFDLNYPIFIEDVNSFKMKYIAPGGKKIQTITLPALDYTQYSQFYRDRREMKAPLEFKYLKENVAYMRIYSFHQGSRDAFHQDFPHLYDSIFSLLNKKATKNLILDLRNNEGGDNTGQQLLNYLMTKPYRIYDYLEEKFIGYPPVKQYLENGDELNFADSFVYKAPSGMYRLKKKYADASPAFNLQQPSPNNFKGNLFVLINGASGSMASVVASFLKGYDRAIFIGEESGGAMEGPTSMAYARLVLPHTAIRIEIPLTKSVHALKYEKGRGVRPDHFVEPNIMNLVKGQDDELNYTLKLIQNF